MHGSGPWPAEPGDALPCRNRHDVQPNWKAFGQATDQCISDSLASTLAAAIEALLLSPRTIVCCGAARAQRQHPIHQHQGRLLRQLLQRPQHGQFSGSADAVMIDFGLKLAPEPRPCSISTSRARRRGVRPCCR